MKSRGGHIQRAVNYAVVACMAFILISGQLSNVHMHALHQEETISLKDGHIVAIHQESSSHESVFFDPADISGHNSSAISISIDGIVKKVKYLGLLDIFLSTLALFFSVLILQYVRLIPPDKSLHISSPSFIRPALRAPPK